MAGPAFKYDASKDLNAAIWNKLTNEQRIAAVQQHHEKDKPHKPTPNLTIHSALHAIVETQIAVGNPVQMKAAYLRMRQAGLSRHDSIHALGSVVAHYVAESQAGTLVGEADYLRALNDLKAEPFKPKTPAAAPAAAPGKPAAKPAAPAKK